MAGHGGGRLNVNDGAEAHSVRSEFEVVSEHPDGRIVLRFTQGAMAGRTVTAYSDAYCELPFEPPLSPRQKAWRLLSSLLDEEQRQTWRTRKTFLVTTAYGAVEFGALYNIGFWPHTPSCSVRGIPPFRLCVVPAGGYDELPEADVWTNLLVVVRGRARAVFRCG